VYFTHAELLETPPVDLRLQSLVVPAVTERFELEAKAGSDENEPLWNESGQEIVPPILDTGAIQFMDGSIRIGQISRVLSDLKAQIDPAQSEAQIRASIGKVLPALQDLPAAWHSCLVAFSGDRLPLIGAVPDVAGVHLFSGFSNPLTIVPPLAQRFANHVAGDNDPIIAQLSPTRFIKIP
jgi:glycine/D-amino acid oxidase-like deaminating enzyme